MQPAAQFRNLLGEGAHLVEGKTQHAPDLLRDLLRLVAQGAAGFGQRNPDLPLVLLVPRPADMAGCLETLQQRGQGAGIEKEPVTDFLHGEIVLLPEHQQNHILRIGQAERVQELAISPAEGMGDGIKGEAQLVAEGQGASLLRHRDLPPVAILRKK
jgi:hypothetical protein